MYIFVLIYYSLSSHLFCFVLFCFYKNGSDIDTNVFHEHSAATLETIVDRLEEPDIDDTRIFEDIVFSVSNISSIYLLNSHL